MSLILGNPHDAITAIQGLRKKEPQGNPSLQNALEMARASLYHVPTHSTKEVIIVFGALISSDAGDIHRTIKSLVEDKVRVRVVGLAAQVAVCRELCCKTNAGDECITVMILTLTLATYGVVLNEQHFRDLLFEVTTPPATHATKSTGTALIMMGFPSRTVESHPSLCAW